MKRAIFVRSKTIVMTELDKKIREKEIYRVTLVGSFVSFLLVILNSLPELQGIVLLCWQMQFILYLTSLRT